MGRMRNRVVSLFLVTVFFSSLGDADASADLSAEADLADWGLSTPSEIGYLSVSLLHKKEGDKLVVSDIRRQKPVVKEPVGPRGRAPALGGDYLVVSHFDRGNSNELGGYFNGFARAPSTAKVTIDRAPDNEPALVFSFHRDLQTFAGFWTHLFDFKAPPAERVFLDAARFGFLTFAIRGEKGGEELKLQVADRAWEKQQDSQVVGDVSAFIPSGKIDASWQRAWVPLSSFPATVNRKELASVVFLVSGKGGAGSGRVFIRDLGFTTKRDVPLPSPKKEERSVGAFRKAMWLWETGKIVENPKEQQQLLDFCREQGITDLFIQIPYEANEKGGKWEILWETSKFPPFMAALHQAGLTVHALDGDPRYALQSFHGRMMALIQGLIQYNRKAGPQERFDGLRYDIEPYLLPQFGGVQKQAILKQYLSLLKASQAAAGGAGMVFGVDIPFWFDGRNEFFEPTAAVDGRPAVEWIIDIVDNIGIMDYRTQSYGADGTIAHAWSELEYAARRGKKVFIGLETVFLPDETMYEFSPNGKGSKILIEKAAGQKIRLTWIPDGETPEGGGVVLNQSGVVQVPASKLTFDKSNRGELADVIRQTASEVSRFPSFYGFAIHSYESYRPWLGKQ